MMVNNDRILILFFIVVAFATTILPASAADIAIDNSSSLQDAVNSAGAGGTVTLSPGTYFEHDITITNDVTIRADTGAGGSRVNTIIDAQSLGRIFFVTRGAAARGNSLTLESLTLRSGKAPAGTNAAGIWENGGTGGEGGAIDSFGTVTVTSSYIAACSGGKGGTGGPGGMWGPAGFGGNGGAGGAINSTYEVTVADTIITGCHAGQGGQGGDGDGDMSPGGQGGDGGSGGAISSDYPITVTSSTITDCSAGTGGTGGQPGNTMWGDPSGNGGGGGSGGAIMGKMLSSSTLTSTTITGCTAGNGGMTDGTGMGGDGGNGGAIASSYEVTLTSSTISGCSAGAGGDSTGYEDGYGGGGGAIYGFNEGCVSVTDSVLSGNSAGNGRTNTAGGPGRTDGGGPGGYGGAIYLYSVVNSRVDAVTSSFTDNTAGNSGKGGAIALDHWIYATSSTFTGNSASSGGATYSWFGVFRFNRIYGNTGAAIVSASTDPSHGISATDNWWGINGNPSAYVSGFTSYNPWLVLGATANPATTTLGGTSAVRANLTFDSSGADTSASGHVPDGISASFATAGGSVLPAAGTTTDGAAETTFTSAVTGVTAVTSTVDGASASAQVFVPITAGFTGTPVFGSAPLLVDFTDTSTCTTPLMWNWSFGDGSWFNTTDIAQRDASHTYATSAAYTVSLTISDAVDTDTLTRTGYITVLLPPPVVAGIDPASGFNQTVLGIADLSGAEFNTTYAPVVRLNRTGYADIVATSVLTPSSSQINCTFDLNDRAAGPWNVVVQNPDGQEGMLAGGFTITTASPVVTGMTPATGYNTTTVTITDLAGSSFWTTGTTGVVLSRAGEPDIVATGVSVSSPTRITCTFDLTDKALGYWDVTVTNPDGKADTLANAFEITPPVPAITAITPASADNMTVRDITNLAGTGFWPGGATAVKLNRTGYADIPATHVTVVSPVRITCTFNIVGQDLGQWNVVVTNPDGQEAMLTGGFTIRNPLPGVPDSPESDGITEGPPHVYTSGTITINVGGDSTVYRIAAAGTGLADLIATGMVIPAPEGQAPPPGLVYEYIDIMVFQFNTITGAEIFFSVPESWFADHKVDPKTIVLYHLTPDGWVALPTTVIETKDGNVYFSAAGTGFSPFAIAGKEGSYEGTVAAAVPATPIPSEDGPAPAATAPAGTLAPAVTRTTAIPVPPGTAPVFPLAAAIVLFGIAVAGIAFLARQWWIRRQNPSLFERS
jgi:PKD repeat protein